MFLPRGEEKGKQFLMRFERVSGLLGPGLIKLKPAAECCGAWGYTYPGGTVWSPNYWPIVMPFAVQHNATTIEVYECDLDYAFGAYPNSRTTTAWVTDETGLTGGCAAWGLLGQDQGYQNSASDTQIG
jgi:hypothetical protein